MDHLRRFGRFYAHSLNKRPILTKSITCAFIVSFGDIVAQRIEHSGAISDAAADGKTQQAQPHDWMRTLRGALYGFGFLAPMLHGWHKFAAAVPTNKYFLATTKFLGVTQQRRPRLFLALDLATRIGIDQGCFSPFLISCFFTIPSGIFAGQNLGQLEEKFRLHFFNTWSTSVMVWPPISVINYLLIPLQYRVLFGNCMAVFWNIFLSYRVHSKHEKAETAHEPSSSLDLALAQPAPVVPQLTAVEIHVPSIQQSEPIVNG